VREWVNLDSALRSREIPETPGAYKIRCVEDGRPRPIPRIFSADQEGLLCIGESARKDGGLRGRLEYFWKAAQGQKAAHCEGKRYCELKYNDNGYPLSDLEVAWQRCDSKGAAKKLQDDWLRHYARKFGELPPLNRQGPRD